MSAIAGQILKEDVDNLASKNFILASKFKPKPMSDFRSLKVYQDARSFNREVFLLLKDPAFDRNIRDQLSRASTSIVLNIAEGSGRFTMKDKKIFLLSHAHQRLNAAHYSV